MRWQKWHWLVFFGLIVIDQLSKSWAVDQGIVIYNSGVSFGLLEQLPSFLLTLLLMTLAGIAAGWWYRTWPEARWSGVFFWSGAVSNLFDRLFWSSVRDFLPVPLLVGSKNNLADWYIFFGLILLGWQLLQPMTKDRYRRQNNLP